ncbi:uncharacterized protein [Haliotis asinina]|uniref:uncharacterized protein n=1 Tax=Haliotis asinina TaxID=109174 RepID=UPI0035318377
MTRAWLVLAVSVAWGTFLSTASLTPEDHRAWKRNATVGFNNSDAIVEPGSQDNNDSSLETEEESHFNVTMLNETASLTPEDHRAWKRNATVGFNNSDAIVEPGSQDNNDSSLETEEESHFNVTMLNETASLTPEDHRAWKRNTTVGFNNSDAIVEPGSQDNNDSSLETEEESHFNVTMLNETASLTPEDHRAWKRNATVGFNNSDAIVEPGSQDNNDSSLETEEESHFNVTMLNETASLTPEDHRAWKRNATVGFNNSDAIVEPGSQDNVERSADASD